MPVKKVNKTCYQWGSGKKYCGSDAKAKAQKQRRAAYANGYKGK